MDTNKVLLYGGAAAAAYFLFLAPSNTSAASILNPTGTTSLLPSGGNMVGISVPVAGRANAVSNYNQLLAADPNLGNPNYQLTAAQISQYMANYLDLAQAMPQWVGHKLANGQTPVNIAQAAQAHWTLYGCAEKRIYYPLQPPSNAPYVPPPVNAKASSSGGGSGWISTALTVAGSVAVALIGDDDRPQLTNADCQMLFTSAAIIKEILPLYSQADPLMTRAIDTKLNAILTQYS